MTYEESFRWDGEYRPRWYSGYLSLGDGEVDCTVEVIPGRVLVDVTSDRRIVGIEHIGTGMVRSDQMLHALVCVLHQARLLNEGGR